jgi:hypothetical protein
MICNTPFTPFLSKVDAGLAVAGNPPLPIPVTFIESTDKPVLAKNDCTFTPGCVGIPPFNKVGKKAGVGGKFTENALLPIK